MLSGKVKVMLITGCSLRSVQSSDGTRERTYLGDIIRAVLSWDYTGTSAYVGCPDGSRVALGSGWDRERVCPCSVSSRMLN